MLGRVDIKKLKKGPPKLKVCAVVGQLRDASVSDRRVVNIESFQLRAVLGHHHEARIG